MTETCFEVSFICVVGLVVSSEIHVCGEEGTCAELSTSVWVCLLPSEKLLNLGIEIEVLGHTDMTSHIKIRQVWKFLTLSLTRNMKWSGYFIAANWEGQEWSPALSFV